MRLPSLIAARRPDPAALRRRPRPLRPPGGARRRGARDGRPVHGLVRAGGADVRAVHAVRAAVRLDAGARPARRAAARLGRLHGIAAAALVAHAVLRAPARRAPSSSRSSPRSAPAAATASGCARSRSRGWRPARCSRCCSRRCWRSARTSSPPTRPPARASSRCRRRPAARSTTRARRPGPYAALTNVVWALLGYHSDATMTRLVALWPLLMLLVLALLGRGRSWRTRADRRRGRRCPRWRCSRSASSSRSCSRCATSSASCRSRCCWPGARRRAGRRAPRDAGRRDRASPPRCSPAASPTSSSTATTRACTTSAARSRTSPSAPGPATSLVYSPQYLGPVVDYYARGRRRAAARATACREPRRGRRVIVLGSFLDKPQLPRGDGRGSARPRAREHELDAARRYPQIRVWEFTR